MPDKTKIIEELKKVLSVFSDLEFSDIESSLFGNKYGLPSFGFVYFILEASKKIGFEITDDFSNALTICSLSNLADVIIVQKSAMQTGN